MRPLAQAVGRSGEELRADWVDGLAHVWQGRLVKSIGPLFFLAEMPPPIAEAWREVELASSPQERMLQAISTLEAALRLVSGMQLASLLATPKASLPTLLRGFEKPSLGSWSKLCSEAHGLLKKHDAAFVDDLLWPDRKTTRLLRKVTTERNEQAHRDGVVPSGIRDRECEAIADDVAVILASLAWLCGRPLIRSLGPGLGCPERVMPLRGTDLRVDDLFSLCETAPLSEGVVYLWDRATRLLDLTPFVALETDRTEEIRLWLAWGKKGDVARRGPPKAPGRWFPPNAPAATERVREVPEFAGLELMSPGPGIERSRATSQFRAARRRLRPRPLAVVAGFVAGVALVGGAVALSAVDGDSLREGAALSAPAAAGSDALDACRLAESLAGEWVFDTHVLGAKRAQQFAVDTVRAHYRLHVHAASCKPIAQVVRTGYTQDSLLRPADPEPTGPMLLAPSASGRSFGGQVQLLRQGSTNSAIDLAVRLTARDGRLFGLWRNEGQERDRAGMWGAIAGRRDAVGAVGAPPTVPLNACVKGCFQGADPLAEDVEPCLIECVNTVMGQLP